MCIIKCSFKFFVPGMLVFFLLTACKNQEPAVQSASAGAAPAQTASASPFYTGDGGKGTSIAILPLKGTGLTADQDYLPALVQSGFVSNFKDYSAIDVLDRAQLQSQYDELLGSGYYDDNAEEGLDLGKLPPTTYIMDGNITRTVTGYALQIQITQSASKMTAASYTGPCTFIELDNLTGIRRASLDLLQKIGVQLTAQAKTELAGAAGAQAVAAQTADARGYAADKGGRTAEAAIYYTQAAAIDPSMLQTANRASTLIANIASGSIGAGTRDLIQQRRDWIALLTETEETIYKLFSSASGNPPYTLYYSNDIQWGDINYQTESRDARLETNLRGRGYWFDSVREAAQSVYGAVYDGLGKTGHKDEWGLGNWPGSGVTQRNPFSTAWRHDITVVFELVNDQGRAIGRQTCSRRAEYGPRRGGNQISIAYNEDDFAPLAFNAVKAADISDSGMSIRVASVNGAPPEQTPFQITMIPDWEINTSLLVASGVITGFRSGIDTSRYRNLVIPATLWAEPVTAIGASAFREKQLSGVVIPHSVTTIGNSAFADNRLSRVDIPDSVTTIGNRAFANNRWKRPNGSSFSNGLRNVVIGKGVTSIADNAFADIPFQLNEGPAPQGIISIPGNVSFVPVLTSEERNGFGSATWISFMKIYDRNSKKGGKYTIGGVIGNWKYSPE